MNITTIQSCADFFLENYLKTFYLVITYNGNSFILIGDKANFPHLMGIQIVHTDQTVTIDLNISLMISSTDILLAQQLSQIT